MPGAFALASAPDAFALAAALDAYVHCCAQRDVVACTVGAPPGSAPVAFDACLVGAGAPLEKLPAAAASPALTLGLAAVAAVASSLRAAARTAATQIGTVGTASAHPL